MLCSEVIGEDESKSGREDVLDGGGFRWGGKSYERGKHGKWSNPVPSSLSEVDVRVIQDPTYNPARAQYVHGTRRKLSTVIA